MSEAIMVMFVGMGTVFAFLVLMVVVMNFSAGIVAKIDKLFPVPEAEPVKAPSVNKAEIAAVIAVARARANG